MKRLILIDSHAIIHRAFHALPLLTSPDGIPVQAVYGFASILMKILKDLKPDYALAAFDHAAPTFRHIAFERYKAQRAKAPDELYAQIPLVKELLAAFGIPIIEQQGFEADDIIGTIVRTTRAKHPDVEIIIVTGDLDALQLVDEKTRVFTMRKGVADTVLYDPAAVHARYGLTPLQLIDFKGLRGDPSDNIPGVRGIGEKTAIELLKTYGSVEGVYRAFKKKSLKAKPGILAALGAHEADALFSKTLATIDQRVPISFTLAAARLRKAHSEEKIRAVLTRFGFFSLLRRLDNGRAASPPIPTRVSAAAADDAIRVVSVRAPAEIRPRDHVVFWQDQNERLLIATGKDELYALALGPKKIQWPAGWFSEKHPAYVFGLKSLLRYGVPADSRSVRDLMLMWWLLEPGRRNYEVGDLLKNEENTIASGESIAQGLYSIALALEKRLHDEELLSVYQEIEAPVTPILASMEAMGIRLDPQPLHALAVSMKRELAELEGAIHQFAGGPFNIKSPQQLAVVLFEKLQLSTRGMRKTDKLGAVSTRESELAKLRLAHPIVEAILRYREITKLKSTYVDVLPGLVKKDGRIHTTWNQTGTATGRLSSQNPNLQNIPIRGDFAKEIRRAFVAEEGFLLVAFDYSQLELRIVADLAKDEKMIQAFRDNVDIHRLTASEVNHIGLGEVTPELRFKAKALNFGVLYGMGARAFSESAGVTRDEAEHFIEQYFRGFRGVQQFIEETKEFARAHGYTKTAFGRKRYFPEMSATNFRLQREAERMAVNHPIQGSAADIMKKAMIGTLAYVKKKGFAGHVRLLLQIHDELLFEIHRDAVGTAAPEIQRIMESVWRGEVTMQVKVSRGTDWASIE